jgi:excisionase family DNA binding protein
MAKELMNSVEVAKYLDINRHHVYDLVRTKRIPATRVTGKWIFPKRLIDEWLESCARANLAKVDDETSPDTKQANANSVDDPQYADLGLRRRSAQGK